MTDNELYHFGVKGMKWGVRRYQNEDGSLTSLGKKRDKMLSDRKVAKRNSTTSNKALRQYNANQRNAKSLKRDLDSHFDSSTGLKLDSETRSAYQHEYNRAVETGRQWLQTRQDILNMPVSSTTVSDIKNRYNKTRRGNVYYPFA